MDKKSNSAYKMNQILNDEKNLFELIQTLLNNKWLIGSFVVLSSLIGFGYSQVAQSIYKVSVPYKINIYSLGSKHMCENNIECLIFSFNKNFEEIINNSDICITRAGASTLAELSLFNIPFIAVPLPHSKDNHQFENALFYKEKECCWMLNQETFENNIEQLLNNILSDNSEFLQKKENLKKLNYKNTWTNVHQKILNIINEN